MKITTKPLTLIKTLIVLIAMSFIVTIPVGVFAAPVKKAWDDSAITQVKENLRQISEAATLWEKSGDCSMRDCMSINNLIAAGKLAKAPHIPDGIGVNNTSPFYSATEGRMGGCGPQNFGAPRTDNTALKGVSAQFCRDYNNSVGLGSTVVENCKSGGDCTASGSTDQYDFPMINGSSFCYRYDDAYAVVWIGTVSAPLCNRK